MQRNKVEEFHGVSLHHEERTVRIAESDLKEVWGRDWATLEETKLEKAALRAASSAERENTLAALVGELQKREPGAKLVVFAPSGEVAKGETSPFHSAAAALQRKGMPPAAVVRDHDDAHNESVVRAFTQPLTLERGTVEPLVLLLSFEQAAGLNLQCARRPPWTTARPGLARGSRLLLAPTPPPPPTRRAPPLRRYVCHHVAMYAPLWAQDTVAAVANEQQAIGRVWRCARPAPFPVHRLDTPDSSPRTERGRGGH